MFATDQGLTIGPALKQYRASISSPEFETVRARYCADLPKRHLLEKPCLCRIA